MNTIKYVLFDWDGCLARTLDLWMDSYKKIFEEYGLAPSEQEIVTKMFGDWEGSKKFGIPDSKTYSMKVVKEVEENYQNVELYPQAEETIRQLQKMGLRMGLVTSSLKTTVKKSSQSQRILRLFDVFLGREDVKEDKPNPEMFNKALGKIGGVKSQSAIVGDSWKDVQAGKNAGIKTVLFYPPENHRFYKRKDLEDENPDYFITTFKKLPNIIRKMN